MAGEVGINLTTKCLQDGSCTLNVYDTLQIRQDIDKNDTETFVQDIVLGGTFFIGTVVTLGLLVSGMMMVFGGAKEDMYQKGLKGLKYSLIGLVLVVSSYIIIRIVQFIAQGTGN